MPSKDRDYKKEYNNYHSKPDQKKDRAHRNAARRDMESKGKVRKGQDVDHKNGNPRDNSQSNLRAQSPSKNRSFPRNSKGGKR